MFSSISAGLHHVQLLFCFHSIPSEQPFAMRLWPKIRLAPCTLILPCSPLLFILRTAGHSSREVGRRRRDFSAAPSLSAPFRPKKRLSALWADMPRNLSGCIKIEPSELSLPRAVHRTQTLEKSACRRRQKGIGRLGGIPGLPTIFSELLTSKVAPAVWRGRTMTGLRPIADSAERTGRLEPVLHGISKLFRTEAVFSCGGGGNRI